MTVRKTGTKKEKARIILLYFTICVRPGCELLRIIFVPHLASLRKPEPFWGWKLPGKAMELSSWRNMPTWLAQGRGGGAFSVGRDFMSEENQIPRSGGILCEAFSTVTHSPSHPTHTLPLREARTWAPCSNLREKRKVGPSPEVLGQGKPRPLGGTRGFSRRRKGRLSPAHGQEGKWLLLRPSPWIARMRWPHLQAWLTLQSLMSRQVDEDHTTGREGAGAVGKERERAGYLGWQLPAASG